MAIDPDGILGRHNLTLTDEETKAADETETEIDDYLLLNFYEGGFCTYATSNEIELPVLYEVIRRFRAARWGTYVSPGTDEAGNKSYKLPLITFWKRSDDILSDPASRIEKILTTQ